LNIHIIYSKYQKKQIIFVKILIFTNYYKKEKKIVQKKIFISIFIISVLCNGILCYIIFSGRAPNRELNELKRINAELTKTNEQLTRLNADLSDRLGEATRISRELTEGIGELVSGLSDAVATANSITNKAERVVILSRAIVEAIRRCEEYSKQSTNPN